MKMLLLLIAILYSSFTYSQHWYLNETEDQIRAKVTTNITIGSTGESKTLHWSEPDLGCSITAMIDNNTGYTWGTIFYPMNESAFKALINFINDKAITISDTKWKFYTGGRVIEADLLYEPDRALKYRITFLLK